jgi:uncharacterized protein (TIGR02246 family)
MRAVLLLVGLTLLGVLCATPYARRVARSAEGVRRDQSAREELLAADRAFAAAAAARGLDGWMSVMAPDAVRLPRLGQPAVTGADAIRRADAALFADPTRRLVWEPTEAGPFADGRHGFTTGRYKVLRRPGTRDAGAGEDQVVASGSYLTWWRKEADGRWLVILDTGTPDPPAAKKSE